MNRLIYLLLALLFLLAFWLRITHIHTMPSGLSRDEAINPIDAMNITQGRAIAFFEDKERPEATYKLFLSVSVILFGSHPTTFRLMSIFWGVLTIAMAYWATVQVLWDRPRTQRQLAGIAAAGALTIALGHITLSRAVYRAIPQPLFMMLFIGMVALSFRTKRYTHFFLTGVALSASIYFYTAGLTLPSVLVPITLSLIIFQHSTYKIWLPRMLLLVIVVAVLTVPFSYTLFTHPAHLFSRTSDVAELGVNTDIQRGIDLTIKHLLKMGDPNPQYNTARAPLVPVLFQPLFILGLFAFIIRGRTITVPIAVTFLVLAAIPSVINREAIHGLRIVGEYGVFPIIIGLGAGLLLAWQPINRWIAPIVIVGLIGIGGIQSYISYTNFWEEQPTTIMHDRTLNNGEWYFRSDRREFAMWLSEQDPPLLVPMRELDNPMTRAWLNPKFPYAVTVQGDFSLPANTRVVIPWELETDGLMDDARLFGLLLEDTIYLLPPLSNEAHQLLIENITQYTPINGTGSLDFLGYSRELPDNFKLSYAVPQETFASFDDGTLIIQHWYGEATLTPGQEATFFIDWRTDRKPDNRYNAFIQLQSINYEKYIQINQPIWPMLYPPTIWKQDSIISDQYELTIPAELPSGAYRLAVGVYNSHSETLLAQASIEDTLDKQATIAWLKVPQTKQPAIPDNARHFDISLNDTFRLRHAAITLQDDRQLLISLFWETNSDRPPFDATIFVHIDTANAEIIAQQDARPSHYPTFIWETGEIIQTDHLLTLPVDGNIDEWFIKIGMYDFPALQRFTVLQSGEPVLDNKANLGKVTHFQP